MDISFSRNTIRFRTNHKCFSIAITNFESFFWFILFLKNVEVRLGTLVPWESTIWGFVHNILFEEVKACCLSIRDFQVTITSRGKNSYRFLFIAKLSQKLEMFTYLSSLVKPYPLKKIGFWVKSLSDRSLKAFMLDSVPLGGKAIWLHCLKWLLTSFGLARFEGM